MINDDLWIGVIRKIDSSNTMVLAPTYGSSQFHFSHPILEGYNQRVQRVDP